MVSIVEAVALPLFDCTFDDCIQRQREVRLPVVFARLLLLLLLISVSSVLQQNVINEEREKCTFYLRTQAVWGYGLLLNVFSI